MNLIVEKSPQIKWYTDLYPFFSRIESIVRSYTWLWTNVDLLAPIPFEEDAPDVYWISGDALVEFVTNRPQFIWSVLSAISPNNVGAARKLDCYPYADGNRGLWINSPKPQHPHAEFEIVCWDSGATLLIGGKGEVLDAFLVAYPGAHDLDTDNQARSVSQDIDDQSP